ncbi:MAG: MFS transporter [Chloroflexi bacterium]|nr:MFS transporter [Chloroflexota bacterium]
MNPSAIAARLRRPRFFYGWVIVLVVMIDGMLSAGIGGYGASVFLRTMSAELGWSRGALSLVAVVRSIMPLFLAPILGRYVDRKHGPRLLVAIGGFGAGLSLILVSQVQELWHFYLTFGLLWGAASVSMGGFLGPAVVSKWFVRIRGRAVALSYMGFSAGGVVVVPMIAFFVTRFGWRAAWVLTGLVVIAVMVPLGGLLMRRRPEDMGLRPDGDPPGDPASQAAAVGGRGLGREERSFTPREAVRERSFWLLVGAFACAMYANPPILFHQVAYMEDKGFSLATAATVATVMAFFAAVSKLPWGLLAERFPTRYLMGICFSAAGISLLLLTFGRSERELYAYAVLHGASFGGMIALFDITWASYFGREHLGALRGVTTPLTIWVSGVSTFLIGLAYDFLGAYDIAFASITVAWLLAAALGFLARPPKGVPSTAMTKSSLPSLR